jgi:putative FmdB family regulatory protein
MPLYEYQCDACGQRFEVIQKFSDPAPEQCAKCGKGPVHRQLSSPAIQFKGSGWYITDYAQKGKSDSGTSAGKSETKTDTTTETKTETKADTKAAAKAEAKPS